jgi:beta-galactosidase GanA
LYDFDNESHARIERVTGNHREANELSVYQALSERHFCVDVLPLSGVREARDLADYQIVFFPHAHILTAADVPTLQAYVEGGGTLIFGCWSGYRDRNHWCYDAAGKAFYESLVHQVSDWCSGAAAYFGWMREVKRENTRCGL